MTPLSVIITIAAYFAILFTVSYIAGRKADNAGFFVGNRKSSWYVVAFAMVGSAISGVTYVSVPGMVAASSFGYLQMVLGFIAGQLIIAYLLVPLFYKMNLVSIYEYLENRFGMSSYRTGAWFFFISKMLGAAVRLFLVCLTLQLLVFEPFGLPFLLNVAITVALVWLYTFQGGVKSLIWTDSLKTFCLVVSVVLCIWYIASDLNLSFTGMVSTIADSDMSRIFFFDDDEGAQFRITDLIRENNRYKVEEDYAFGKPHGFSWGSGAVGIMRDGRRVPPENPTGLRPEGDHVVIEFDGREKLELRVTLEAYDVSGQEIRDFLRTRGNMPTKAALFMGEERFPAGSVAYAATLWIIQDELLALSHTAFTGSNNIEDFSERFTKETPYCLNVLPGDGVTPVGLRFEKTIKKKTGKEKIKTRRGTKTRTVELPQNGLVNVYHTKSGTIFCQRSKPDPVVKARWDLRYLNGTRTLTVDFPTLIDSLSIGLMTANRGKLMPAFAEELTPTSRKTRVIPTAVWLKNERIRDSQYRFNKTAATAVKAAIEASRPRRKAWEAANESDVTRRARALQAKKAASGKARRTPAKKR